VLLSEANQISPFGRLTQLEPNIERLHSFPRDQLNKSHGGHVGVPRAGVSKNVSIFNNESKNTGTHIPHRQYCCKNPDNFDVSTNLNIRQTYDFSRICSKFNKILILVWQRSRPQAYQKATSFTLLNN
jgi:hypothetical protein